MHDLHPMHLSLSTTNGALCLTVLSSAHGRREMITDGSSAASSSLIASSHALRSYGSTTRTRLMPIARHSASRLILPAGSPLMLSPVVGFC